ISFMLLIKLSLLSSPLPMPYLFQASSTDNTSNLSKIALPNTTLSPLFLFSFFTKKKNDSPSVSTLKLLEFFLQKLTSSMLLLWDKYVTHSLDVTPIYPFILLLPYIIKISLTSRLLHKNNHFNINLTYINY